MKELISHIAESVIKENNLFLIKSIIRGKTNSPIIEIFIDNETGIDADVCSKISRLIADKLNETKLADLDYRLIVSSPGVDEPLIYLGQYKKHLGRTFDLSYTEESETKKIDAKLLEIKDGTLVFQNKKDLIEINYNKIKKAKVKISF